MSFEHLTENTHEVNGEMVDTLFYGITREAYLKSQEEGSQELS